MKQLVIITCGIALSLFFTSCESCAKKVAKKATNIGISMAEGVNEAINERGEALGEKTTDALGEVAKGAGKSIDRQLNEHAEYVASVAGRTIVQAVEGIDKGSVNEYYTRINTTTDLCTGVSLDYFGKITSKPVLDAYFIIMNKENFTAFTVEFDFLDSSNKSLIKKSAEITKVDHSKKYTLVSFALNDDELAKFSNTSIVTVKEKK
ncbi:MAG: hypothetical protein LBM68_05370 [Bacteroidales bacterium]|jgi:hypothetical protein|nr:hypothetical protein [Bacteroidales bacterium]